MIAARHRFPSRGSAAIRTHARRWEGPMATPLPPEKPSGQFTGQGAPVQDLLGTGLRELMVGMLDAATAIRLGSNTTTDDYEGTVLPNPQAMRSPSDSNSGDEVEAGARIGNAPQVLNKTANSSGMPEPPRIASTLPIRGR